MQLPFVMEIIYYKEFETLKSYNEDFKLDEVS
jgi:hypothetical protein